MERTDTLISPVGVEDPVLHTISVNDVLYNVAIELKLIVMLGASIASTNSEYREFNLDIQIVSQVFKCNTKNKNINLWLKRIYTAIKSNEKNDTITGNDTEIKNITVHGLDYTIMYYLLIKRYSFSEQQCGALNAFSTFQPVLDLFDIILKEKKVALIPADLKAFADVVSHFRDSKYQIGSKFLSLTKNQIERTNDLSQSVWKSMYIDRILRNLPARIQKPLFAPSLGWGLIRCVTKHVFTNQTLIDQAAFGENIRYIQTTAKKQNKLASQMSNGALAKHSLDDVKRLTADLNEATKHINYALGDLALVVFYSNMGKTMFEEINRFIEETKMKGKIVTSSVISDILTNHESFQHFIFQYLYSIFVLTKQGVIHNDPHLHNILLSKTKATKHAEYQLSPSNVISMPPVSFSITIIDFGKSILSHQHQSFTASAKKSMKM